MNSIDRDQAYAFLLVVVLAVSYWFPIRRWFGRWGTTPADLARVAAHVLVVLGDQDPAGPGDGLVAALPDARPVTLRGVDHFGTPADVRCMQAVLGFLGC